MKKVNRFYIIFISFILFFSCLSLLLFSPLRIMKSKVVINQDIQRHSYLDNSFYVSTSVYVYKWNGIIDTIEYWDVSTCYQSEECEKIKQEQNCKALVIFYKLKSIKEEL